MESRGFAGHKLSITTLTQHPETLSQQFLNMLSDDRLRCSFSIKRLCKNHSPSTLRVTFDFLLNLSSV